MDDVAVCVVLLVEELGQRISCGQVEFANSTDGCAQWVETDDSELERGTGPRKCGLRCYARPTHR